MLLGNFKQKANKSIVFIQISVKRLTLLSKELCQPEILSHFTTVKVLHCELKVFQKQRLTRSAIQVIHYTYRVWNKCRLCLEQAREWDHLES